MLTNSLFKVILSKFEHLWNAEYPIVFVPLLTVTFFSFVIDKANVWFASTYIFTPSLLYIGLFSDIFTLSILFVINPTSALIDCIVDGKFKTFAFVYLLNVEETRARGTSVFCILPMVITSSLFYYKDNFIDWKIAILCAIGGSIGGFIGAKLLKKLPVKVFKIMFIIFLIYASYNMLK